MPQKFLLVSFLILVLTVLSACDIKILLDDDESSKQTTEAKRGDYRIMFYNCENLFDTKHDTLKNDHEFLPDGAKHWTYQKYITKLAQISKVITAIGGWDPPEIVGLCEVENRFALYDLIKKTGLKKHSYDFIHKESPDMRGVDVALLYLKNRFFPISYQAIPVEFPNSMGKRTRDILYVCGYTVKRDTLHVFVNHWPSRWGGEAETEEKRIFTASVARKSIDSIFSINPHANIVLMGDLNDYPQNSSLLETMKAQTEYNDIKNGELYSMAWYLQETKGLWTHKMNGEGGILDQIIISGSLLKPTNSIFTTLDNAHVFNADFLLENDEQYFGYKPYRTYLGYKYHGGFSDHLPVYLDLFFKNE